MVVVLSNEGDQRLVADELEHNLSNHHPGSATVLKINIGESQTKQKQGTVKEKVVVSITTFTVQKSRKMCLYCLDKRFIDLHKMSFNHLHLVRCLVGMLNIVQIRRRNWRNMGTTNIKKENKK